LITFSQFPYARFGNNLWEIAAIHSFAKHHNTTYQIPKWSYSKYFISDLPETDNLPKPDVFIKEPTYKYNDFVNKIQPDKVTDILGYFQDVRYFSSPEDIRELFKFKPEYIDRIRETYKHLFTRETIFVGVRRTDYVSKPGYYNLPPLYYILALQKLEYKNKNIVFISDDVEWCKFHFGCLENTFFPEFESDIDQFICGTLADNWIIANSTFHFWAAYLGNPIRVIQPNHLFADHLYKEYGDTNFYIQNDTFEIFEHEDKRIDLSDVTFTIPVHHDHDDRKWNLELIICLLQQNFKTNIIVGEQGSDFFKYTEHWGKYIKFEDKEFHRTKFLNHMASVTTTDIVVNLDADVMVAPAQLLQAVELIRDNKADMVYPYQYLFARIPKMFRNKIFPKYDLEAFRKIGKGNDTPHRPSYGGMVVYNRRLFLENGGENENFVSFNPEDYERFERFTKLGLKIERVKGNLYHFDHHIGLNSSTSNPLYNPKELEKVKSMTPTELREYVNTWEWIHPYTEKYYEDISGGASKSFELIFEHLPHHLLINATHVIDLGCGVGHSAKAAKKYFKTYTGVDYKIPTEKLLISENEYLDCDLRYFADFGKYYDLVICTEVAEHIEERYANNLVGTICSAANLVLFSAAVTGQGGLGHYNEQMQSYWVEKFKAHGYDLCDYQIREKILTNKEIEYWYRQNILLFMNHKNDNKVFGPYLDYILPHNLR
jgi:SAM-dependent methyltransferase